MNITPGNKLNSAVSAAQFVVIRGTGEHEITHGGEPLTAPEAASEPSGAQVEGAVLVGKRYSDASGDIEFLCVKPGAGDLVIDGTPMTVKAAKALPASD